MTSHLYTPYRGPEDICRPIAGGAVSCRAGAGAAGVASGADIFLLDNAIPAVAVTTQPVPRYISEFTAGCAMIEVASSWPI